MRKHFLILMLFALLPLAGWAQPGGKTEYAGTNVDLSHDWSIWLSATASTYTGGDIRPDVYLVSSTEYISAEGHFNVQWSATNVRDFVEGGYTVTVTPDNTFSYNALPKPTATFMILKSNLTVENAGALQDNPASGVDYSGDAITLVKTAPTVKIGATSTKVTGLKYAVTASTVTKAPSTGWSTSFPTATEVGVYKVWFKAEATNNYNEKIGTVGDDATYEIEGRTLVEGVNNDYVAPLATDATLTFTWENNAAKPLNLVKAGTGTIAAAKGTMKYAVDPTNPANITAWSTTATATKAGTHTVYWKIEGGTGYKDVVNNTTQKFNVLIAQATTVITSAVGKTGLSYKVDGDHKQALIQTAATATNGASSVIKYQVNYSSDDGENWDGWSAATAKLEEVTGDKAGLYEIKSLMEANQNYVVPTAKTTRVTIAKANAFTSAPTAADLTWNKTDQVLIAAGANTVEGVVEYAPGANATTAPTTGWVDDLTTIKGQDAGDYYVWYRVNGATNTNFVNVPATVVKDVKIKRKDLTVTVNNITKTYDATASYTGTTIDGNATAGPAADANEKRFTFAGRIANDELTFSSTNVPYVALAATCKNAGEYAEAVTVLETKLKAVSDNYRYTIIPGKLTVNKAKLKVDAKTKHVTFGNPYDIRGEWTATGLQGSDKATTAEDGIFQTLPVLTTNAAATNPAPSEYDYTFTNGVLKTTAPGSNYEMDTTYGENKDGYKIGTAKFIVDQDPDAKVIITVAPHTQAYTGVAESWEGMQPGVDYYVTGLIDGDALTAYPTLSRSDATNFNVGVYDLEATGAAVADITKYPGGIIYQKSTFEITKAELTATVNPQTITTLENNSNIDQDAWTVTGLVNGEAKTVLGGTLAINTTADGPNPGQTKATLSTPGVYGGGIMLTITSGNYTLKAGSQYGELRIINPSTLELNDAEDMTTVLASANNSTTTDISFNSRTLKKDTWNTLILPFDIKVRDLSEKLGYAVVDMLDKSNTDAGKVIFKITTGTIPANTPFMIKTDEAVNLQSIVFTAGTHFTKIAYTTAATCEVADAAGNKLTGAYKPQTVNDGEYYMNGSGNWKKYAGTGFTINGERVKFTKASASVSAPTFYIEEGDGTTTVFDGETTAITRISSEELNVTDGWYTLNGAKLQNMPTEKGIYIRNGKKVVIK